ncbi:hypothetical protein [Embleya sp. AB8]|uniref:hypothetical protein n=1 Tax=Embleya sp. AB8 TaxID=3156304 RepID=UPI003C789B86
MSVTTTWGSPRLAFRLHQRTAGRIGSLTRLIRQAAVTAIDDGTERITKSSLDAVRLDHLAENTPPPAITHIRAVGRPVIQVKTP